jgi:hypothetical protein
MPAVRFDLHDALRTAESDNAGHLNAAGAARMAALVAPGSSMVRMAG